MKKNVMMRVASALLVAVLMTTCAISGTFAKYTSNVTDTETARVAKWGWGTTAITIDDLFKNVYGDNVASSNGEDVIAPGTGSSTQIAWTPDANFKPEVDYTVTLSVSGTIPAEVEARLSWTLKVGDAAEQTYTDFAALAAALGTQTFDFEANTAPSIPTVTIGWTWPIGSGDADNNADTDLGNAGTLAQCSVTVALTATQKG